MTDLAEQVADTLEAAADYIDEHGWCQFEAHADNGAVCAEGAICEVTETWEQQRVVYDLFIDAGCPNGLYHWNDTRGREQWEVDELLRSTAKKVRHGDLELS